jgi:hypothetical protein
LLRGAGERAAPFVVFRASTRPLRPPPASLRVKHSWAKKQAPRVPGTGFSKIAISIQIADNASALVGLEMFHGETFI